MNGVMKWWGIPLVVWCIACSGLQAADAVTVASLEELAAVAAKSDQVVTMKPGVYRFKDYLPPAAIAERRARKEFQYLTFSGNGNVFRFEGVTLELDTALRGAYRPPIHTDEILVKGDRNTIEGLTVVHIGDGKSLGGAALGVIGRGNTLKGCRLTVRGSAPYGYGDLFGKGGHKKSGVHITGHGTTILDCHLRMHSFGHGFYIQEDAADVRLEGCTVEGNMRATDEILSEKTGMAVDRAFRSEMKNRAGENKVTPGYMKALSEDGFRTYGTHPNLVLKNCTAKHMRGGFELRTKTAPRLENCVAEGNERAFWVSTGATLVNCRGDAQFGPLLYVEGDNATIDVECLPAESPQTVHALAAIYGTGNTITITAKNPRPSRIPILIGFAPPGMGEGSAPMPERPVRKLTLENRTAMPVRIGAKAADCTIRSVGPIEENLGKDIRTGESPQPK